MKIWIEWGLLFAILIRIRGAKPPHERPSEQERVALWLQKNTWPPQWQDETPAMQRVLAHRERQIMNISYAAERWENWLQFTQNRLVPKFTTRGFELAQTPTHVHEKLVARVDEALKSYEDIPTEGKVDVIYAQDSKRPKFVNMWDAAQEAHKDLLEIHEKWAGGVKLKPTSAYGVRLYQNGSSLVMHYDRVETHVISSIVHLVHEYDDDNNPWPIQIEDHDGVLHTVNLEAGQMLFYESAKCLHGRMKEFRGKYYGSLFLHYQPVDSSIWNFVHDDVIASVPPHWRDGHLVEGKGPRYAGACITVEGRTAAGAPPLKIEQSDSIPIMNINTQTGSEL